MVGLSPNCEIWGGGGVFFVPMKIKDFRKKKYVSTRNVHPCKPLKMWGGGYSLPSPPSSYPRVS